MAKTEELHNICIFNANWEVGYINPARPHEKSQLQPHIQPEQSEVNSEVKIKKIVFCFFHLSIKMAKISAVLVLLSLAVACTNAGVRTDYLSEPSLEIQVLRNSVLSRPKVRIVAPAEGPTYVVSPLRVNIPLGPLVFPAIADVPENAIIKSPPVKQTLAVLCIFHRIITSLSMCTSILFECN